jgi:hypothetical protein
MILMLGIYYAFLNNSKTASSGRVREWVVLIMKDVGLIMNPARASPVLVSMNPGRAADR